MFLKKLSSEPPRLFQPVEFKNGINFIFGKKHTAKDTKESLNGIGKSTLLDLIDFCLLSDFSKKNTRLYKEKKRLTNHKIVLEFEIQGIHYLIKRTVDKPRDIEFGLFGQTPKVIKIDDLKEKLFGLIFDNPDYSGKLNSSWYRKLMLFFLKIHKRQRGQFLDPIKYISSEAGKEIELNQYHFFLLGIDNTLLYRNYDAQQGVNERNTAIREVKRLVENNYQIDIKNVESEINKLERRINKIKKIIESFQLAEQYDDVEAQANLLTRQIKELSAQNFWDNKKIEAYQESFELKDILDTRKITQIKKLYSETHLLLGENIGKSLAEAVQFRKQLASSREEFLSYEINALQTEIKKRREKIKKWDEERAQLFLFLDSKEALKDLTGAFYNLAETKTKLSELESKVKTYHDLLIEKADWELKDKKINREILEYVEIIKPQISIFYEILSSVYNDIYPKNQDNLSFSVSPKPRTNAKLSININFDDGESKGQNRGRTLVYDLAVLLHTIKNNINCPRFLIHDGLFDGMDKAHFIELYNFIENTLLQGIKFQYIITLNEEGTLNQNFGDFEKINTDQIEKEAITVLTPVNKFWYYRGV
ncbi:MAG: DUF2326 domain-containing protein [Pseudomonadota bacterium]